LRIVSIYGRFNALLFIHVIVFYKYVCFNNVYRFNGEIRASALHVHKQPYGIYPQHIFYITKTLNISVLSTTLNRLEWTKLSTVIRENKKNKLFIVVLIIVLQIDFKRYRFCVHEILKRKSNFSKSTAYDDKFAIRNRFESRNNFQALLYTVQKFTTVFSRFFKPIKYNFVIV